ncbi:MAG: metallophosphoesterase [Oscillospiraceae bacterium]|nr:metallophosphoesterase [Oscillospiraceae bacterium]
MKILVVSDSHGNKKALLEAAGRETPDVILHLGDYARDCLALRLRCPGRQILAVRGNCDGPSPEPAQRELTLAGKKILMTHGHLYGVKRSTETLEDEGFAQDADAVLYGHTHVAGWKRLGNMLLINPGSIGFEGTYAVLTIEDGQLRPELKHL